MSVSMGLSANFRGDRRLVADSRRYARYQQLRKQRRRQGALWAIMAAMTLLAAWDVASRIDDVSYSNVSYNESPQLKF